MISTQVSARERRTPAREKALARFRNPWMMRAFLFWKLPAGFRAGLRIESVDYDRCVVSIPFRRSTQNPFRSTYFACLSMAAELSTGALGLLSTTGTQPSTAMLVTNMEGDFVKKATERIYFTCEQGDAIFSAVERTQATGEPETVTATSIGRTADGVEVARFTFTWSFKRRGGGFRRFGE